MQGWSLFATSFLVGLSGAVMPGPLVTVAIAGVGRLGAASGFVASAGHGIPEALLVLGLAYGLGSVLRLPAVGGTIAVAGGLSLVWMAVGMFRSAASAGIAPAAAAGGAPAGQPDDPAVAANGRGGGAATASVLATPASSSVPRAALSVMASGAVASLSNPYWILWWATIGAGYVTQALASGWAGVGFFFGGHILSDVAWLGLVSTVIAAGSRFLSPAFYTWLVRVLAASLAGLAVYFVLTGYHLLVSG